MKRASLLGLLASAILPLVAPAGVVYTHPPDPAGGQYKSAWYPPDGLDGDSWAFDSFVLPTSEAITEVRWRGAYTNYLSGAGKSPVFEFTIAFYGSRAANTEPDVIAGPLVEYTVSGNCGETPAGTFGGVIMYDYACVLPSPFQATAGTKYWVQIEASQGLTPTYHWPPDWSMAVGTGGNGAHFQKTEGEGPTFQSLPKDLAFSLLTSSAPTVTIAASAAPQGAGTILGAGDYPVGSTASLLATPNAGWGFVNWTENGVQVKSTPQYNFTATVDRTLLANFVPAYTITTGSLPTYGGWTTGGGVYNSGSSVTVTATPANGYVFDQWTDFGNPVSNSATFTFSAGANRSLMAHFQPDAVTVPFDFDDAPGYTSLPITLTVNGLTADLSATGGGYSIQRADTLGFTPAGFGGLCVYPNSVFPADLLVDFSEPLTDFSIMYSPQELGCDDSATMKVTATMDGVLVGSNTTTAAAPGTWPTGTLSFSSAQPFNGVVVHYQSRPPTCQDWGPIFLADNMIVSRAGAPACVGDLADSGSGACGLGGDGAMNTDDFICFLQLFAAGDLLADIHDSTAGGCGIGGDGALNSDDFICFLTVFASGCP